MSDHWLFQREPEDHPLVLSRDKLSPENTVIAEDVDGVDKDNHHDGDVPPSSPRPQPTDNFHRLRDMSDDGKHHDLDALPPSTRARPADDSYTLRGMMRDISYASRSQPNIDPQSVSTEAIASRSVELISFHSLTSLAIPRYTALLPKIATNFSDVIESGLHL